MPEPGLGSSSLATQEAGDPGPDDTADPRVSNRSQGSGASPSPAAPALAHVSVPSRPLGAPEAE